jgi:four helix bundle protein
MKSNSSAVLIKSKEFALCIIDLYRFLSQEKKEFIISKQILRSGTSVGANAKEASLAQSKADFIAKLSISLKESGETEYWLELLFESNFIDKNQFNILYTKNKELIKIITSILKTTKANNC